jgi:copper chaperone CopZ
MHKWVIKVLTFCFVSLWISLISLCTFVSISRAEFVDIRVGVWGTACMMCNNFIEQKLRLVPGVKKELPNLKESTFTLILNEGALVDVAAIRKAIKTTGYEYKYVQITLTGFFENSQGKYVLKEPTTGQVFQLAKGENLPLAPDKLEEIKKLSENGVKKIEVKGMAYPQEGMNILEPIKVSAVQ